MSGERDNRGAYGFGRAAHGSDPQAQYGFTAGREAASLRAFADVVSRCTAEPEARVLVRDLDFVDDANRAAEVTFTVASGDDAFDVTVRVVLETAGAVEEAITCGRLRLAALLRAAARELESGAPRRS